MHIRVSEAELRRDNQQSVALTEGGGYLGWMGVFHGLHCIVGLFLLLLLPVTNSKKMEEEEEKKKKKQTEEAQANFSGEEHAAPVEL